MERNILLACFICLNFIPGYLLAQDEKIFHITGTLRTDDNRSLLYTSNNIPGRGQYTLVVEQQYDNNQPVIRIDNEITEVAAGQINFRGVINRGRIDKSKWTIAISASGYQGVTIDLPLPSNYNKISFSRSPNKGIANMDIILIRDKSETKLIIEKGRYNIPPPNPILTKRTGIKVKLIAFDKKNGSVVGGAKIKSSFPAGLIDGPTDTETGFAYVSIDSILSDSVRSLFTFQATQDDYLPTTHHMLLNSTDWLAFSTQDTAVKEDTLWLTKKVDLPPNYDVTVQYATKPLLISGVNVFAFHKGIQIDQGKTDENGRFVFRLDSTLRKHVQAHGSANLRFQIVNDAFFAQSFERQIPLKQTDAIILPIEDEQTMRWKIKSSCTDQNLTGIRVRANFIDPADGDFRATFTDGSGEAELKLPFYTKKIELIIDDNTLKRRKKYKSDKQTNVAIDNPNTQEISLDRMRGIPSFPGFPVCDAQQPNKYLPWEAVGLGVLVGGVWGVRSWRQKALSNNFCSDPPSLTYKDECEKIKCKAGWATGVVASLGVIMLTRRYWHRWLRPQKSTALSFMPLPSIAFREGKMILPFNLIAVYTF